jgi:hypothetical protein
MVFPRHVGARFAGAECPIRATRCLADPYHSAEIGLVIAGGLPSIQPKSLCKCATRVAAA